MSKPMQKFLINVGTGLVIVVLVMWVQGVFETETTSDALRLVCDGFFVAAVVLLGWGSLRWCTNGGAVDGLGYSMKMVKDRLLPFLAKPNQKRESFAEYRERRESKAISAKPLLLSGLVHLVIALVVFGIYSIYA